MINYILRLHERINVRSYLTGPKSGRGVHLTSLAIEAIYFEQGKFPKPFSDTVRQIPMRTFTTIYHNKIKKHCDGFKNS